MYDFEWQLYVIVALSVLIGILVGMLIGGERKSKSEECRVKSEDIYSFDPRSYINQATETIEVEGQTLYILHKPC